ncbi:MAG: phosphotransferase [Pseudomonadota bacterium]
MEVQSDVPYSIEDLNAGWLSQGLQATGVIDSSVVADFSVSRLGGQVGFNGEVAIIAPTYTPPADDAPARLVLKIPTTSKNRILGQTMGLYEKEIRFYRDLQPGMKIRTPRHYFSALDAADDPDVILERMRGMNRLPLWTIRAIMALATRFVTSHPRHYALLIEDLSAYRMGDQAVGCSEADMRNIVATMARLHAQFWASESLHDMSWIMPYTVTSRIMQMRYRTGIERYLAEAGATLSAGRRAVLQWLRQHGIELTETFGAEPATLLHGDFRLDNLCFDDTTGEVVLFDWQTMLAGPGASDLAYFISATLPEATDEALVDLLIDVYHRELDGQGIDVPRERLRWQYEIGMLTMLHRLLPATYPEQMDLDAERGLPLLEAWIGRIYARLEHVGHERILEQMS